MSQSQCVKNDITKYNPPTVVGVNSSSKNNHNNKCTMSSYTIPPLLWKTNHDSQLQISSSSSSSLAFLSSSPTDVVLSLSSSSTLFQQQQQQQQQQYLERSPWPIFPMSKKAQRTHNPIRAILDPILQSSNGTNHNHNNNCGKTQISLALGDPIAVTQTESSSSSSTTTTTTTVPLLPCPHAIRAILSTLSQSDSSTAAAAASYSNAIGTIEGRRAIAKYHSHPPYYTYHPDNDIIIANGCSGALDILLTSLLDHHHHHSSMDGNHASILLVPSPGFPLYRVIAESNGTMVVSYPLLPNQQWEIDLIQLQNIMEQYQSPWYDSESYSNDGSGSDDDSSSRRRHLKNTTTTTIRGIVINNPSNPTGAVYSTTHLQQIVHLCQQYHIPIIADEIYGDMIFPGRCRIMDHSTTHPMDTSSQSPTTISFVSIAQIAAQMGRIVPVITASGIGKQFLLPGWRIGWICFQDNIYGSLQQVKDGAKRLAQIVLGASHLAQVAIPALLLTPPTELYNADDNKNLENALLCSDIGIVEYRRSYNELMEWKTSVRHTLYEQSKVLCTALQRIGPCLQVIEPQGAMYAMVRINLECFDDSTIRNDIDFTKLLYQEENVVVLPGTCFDFPNSFRVVFCAPMPILDEAAHRIHQFCHRHLKH